MKKFWIQIMIILGVSVAIALAYNQLSKSPLPLFKKYVPDAQTDRDTGEDLSVYYNEMDAETLESLKDTGTIVLLDAREALRFDEGHIPGAVSLPIMVFQERYDQVVPLLEDGKTIVIYCIGIHCTDSALLARELHHKGHQEIFVFKGGIEEWTALGYPVQTPDGIEVGNEMEGGEEDEHHHEL